MFSSGKDKQGQADKAIMITWRVFYILLLRITNRILWLCGCTTKFVQPVVQCEIPISHAVLWVGHTQYYTHAGVRFYFLPTTNDKREISCNFLFSSCARTMHVIAHAGKDKYDQISVTFPVR